MRTQALNIIIFKMLIIIITNGVALFYTGILSNEISLGNGKVISQTFDGLNRISSLNNGIKNYSYSYDDISNIVSDSFKNYTFDDFSRLTQVHETLSGTLLETFGFDKIGNRMSDISENEYDVNILNQYTSLTGSLNVNFTYDNNGNLISDGEKIFSYDYKNRLIKVENTSGIIAEFAYDVLGRRYEKKTNSETISYIYADKNIVSETTLLGENSFTKHYVNGLGIDNVLGVIQDESDLSFEELGELNFCNARILTYSASFLEYGWNNIVTRCEDLSNGGNELITNTYYFHKNHLGSIVGITDVSGNVVSEYEYDSFGNFTLSGSDIGNARLFTGREFDFEIGLYYNRARYYSSELGRFISRDPIGQIDDVNLYAYVGNNPVMFSDPNGETKQLIAGATLGDYNENGNGWSTTGQILTGFVPYYGQVADVRDFSYQWENGTKTDIAFAGIAFIPGIGDGAKALKNSGAIQKGFKSFKELKNYLGGAGLGNAWHHIVEQHTDNITKFGAEKIHSIENVVKLPHLLPGSIHRKITGYYNSLEDFGSGLELVRDVVKKWDFEKQYNFGIQKIKDFGGSEYLK